MRRFTCAAAAGTATVVLSALWIEPAAMAAPAAGPPTIAGNGPLVAAKFSCPHLAIPRCAKGYRGECIRWAYGGPKGPNMVKCCGRMGCAPHFSNTREPLKPPRPMPWSRLR
jgi:hypothetical protein